MKICVVLALAAFITAGCGKKEEGRSDAPQPAAAAHQGSSPPVSPIPERPAPDVPKGAVPDAPKPGQVNNHSSPEFKGGGDSDKK